MKLISLFAFLLSLFSPQFAKADDSQCDLLQIEELSGEVRYRSFVDDETEAASVNSEKSAEEAVAAAGDEIHVGDRIQVGVSSWVDLRFCDGSVIRLNEHSDFQYLPKEQDVGWVKWSFELFKGSLRSLFQGNGEDVKLRIKTPTAALGVRGTEFYLEVDEDESRLYTFEGAVLWGQRTKWRELRADRRVRQAEFLEVKKDLASSARKGRPLGPIKKFDHSILDRKEFLLLRQKKLERSEGFRRPLVGKQNKKIFQRNRPILEKRMMPNQNPKLENKKRGQGQRLNPKRNGPQQKIRGHR